MAKGSLTHYKDDVWHFVVDLPRKPDGSRNQKRYTIHAASELEAEEKRLQILRDIQLQTPGDVDPTLRDFMGNWLKTYVEQELAAATQEQYRTMCENHIWPTLGELRLNEVTPYHVKLLKDSKADKLSNNSRRIMLAVLRKALNDALSWELIDSNPCRKVSAPKKKKAKVPQYLELREVHKFLMAAKGYRYAPLFFTAIYTGMRLGELLGMKWSDIDGDKVHVRHNLNKRFELKEVKRGMSRRTIPLSKENQDVLGVWRRRQAAEQLKADYGYNPWGLVFTSSNGKYVRHNIVRRQQQKIVEKAGIQRITPHGLRHTHATLLLKAGVHPKVVQERLGHSSITTTLDTYSHVIPSLQDDLAASLDTIIGNGSNQQRTMDGPK